MYFILSFFLLVIKQNNTHTHHVYYAFRNNSPQNRPKNITFSYLSRLDPTIT